LQGDFREHIQTLEGMGVDAVDVRRPEQLDEVEALIIPGGESTTIGKLAAQYGIIPKLRERVAEGMPVWGTCAGAIFIAKEVPGHPHPIAGLMDMTVERNAFGRQVDSFESDLDVRGLGPEPFHAVFIRAPLIARVGPGVEVLATLDDGTIVAARQGRLLATSFHPELTPDRRLHEHFLSLVRR
jgi:5'-phosphate synthase pdxT subunit